jgi:pimeloyl-ACP methyl ester carboxylesterase
MTRNRPRTIDKKTAKARHDTTPDRGARERLLATLPVAERRLRLNGVCTAVLEGGQGLPIVCLHSLGEYAAKWLRVSPDLGATHRVVAPDPPGQGASEASEELFDVERVGWTLCTPNGQS